MTPDSPGEAVPPQIGMEIRDCKPGTPVWYYPSQHDPTRFAGTVADEPRMLGDTPVVRLVEMESAYGEWRKAPRTTVPAASLLCLARREGEAVPAPALRREQPDIGSDCLCRRCEAIRQAVTADRAAEGWTNAAICDLAPADCENAGARPAPDSPAPVHGEPPQGYGTKQAIDFPSPDEKKVPAALVHGSGKQCHECGIDFRRSRPRTSQGSKRNAAARW